MTPNFFRRIRQDECFRVQNFRRRLLTSLLTPRSQAEPLESNNPPSCTHLSWWQQAARCLIQRIWVTTVGDWGGPCRTFRSRLGD